MVWSKGKEVQDRGRARKFPTVSARMFFCYVIVENNDNG